MINGDQGCRLVLWKWFLVVDGVNVVVRWSSQEDDQDVV